MRYLGPRRRGAPIPAVVPLLVALLLAACAADAGAGAGSTGPGTADPPQAQRQAGDIAFDMKGEYRLGEPVEVAIRNNSDVTYYYQRFYPACYNLRFFDDSAERRRYPYADPVREERLLLPGQFIVPQGTHCDLISESPIGPGERAVLLVWDQEVCLRDRWGCLESAPVGPGRYRIEGAFSPTPRATAPGREGTPGAPTTAEWTFVIGETGDRATARPSAADRQDALTLAWGEVAVGPRIVTLLGLPGPERPLHRNEAWWETLEYRVVLRNDGAAPLEGLEVRLLPSDAIRGLYDGRDPFAEASGWRHSYGRLPAPLEPGGTLEVVRAIVTHPREAESADGREHTLTADEAERLREVALEATLEVAWEGGSQRFPLREAERVAGVAPVSRGGAVEAAKRGLMGSWRELRAAGPRAKPGAGRPSGGLRVRRPRVGGAPGPGLGPAPGQALHP